MVPKTATLSPVVRSVFEPLLDLEMVAFAGIKTILLLPSASLTVIDVSLTDTMSPTVAPPLPPPLP